MLFTIDFFRLLKLCSGSKKRQHLGTRFGLSRGGTYRPRSSGAAECTPEYPQKFWDNSGGVLSQRMLNTIFVPSPLHFWRYCGFLTPPTVAPEYCGSAEDSRGRYGKYGSSCSPPPFFLERRPSLYCSQQSQHYACVCVCVCVCVCMCVSSDSTPPPL